VARVLLPISRPALPHHIGRASSPIPSGAAFALPRSYRAQTFCAPNSKRCATRQMSDPCTSHTLPSSSGRVLTGSYWPVPHLLFGRARPPTSFGAAFRLAFPLRCAGSGGSDHGYPRWGGHTLESVFTTSPVSGLPASLMETPASTPPPLMSRSRGSATLCSGCWVSALLERLAPSWLMPMA